MQGVGSRSQLADGPVLGWLVSGRTQDFGVGLAIKL